MIGRFMTGTYTVSRKAAGYYKDGYYQHGPDEVVTVTGSLQPTNARELKLTSDGGRLRQYWKFYSDQPLVTINTKTLAGADVVTINGDKFKVMSVESWQHVDLPYYKSILYREPEQ